MPQHLPAHSPLPFPALSCPVSLRTLPCRRSRCRRVSPARVPVAVPGAAGLRLSASLDVTAPGSGTRRLLPPLPSPAHGRGSPCAWMEQLGRDPQAGTAPGTHRPGPGVQSGDPEPFPAPWGPPGWRKVLGRDGMRGAEAQGQGRSLQQRQCCPCPVPCPHPASPPCDTPETLPSIPPLPRYSWHGLGVGDNPTPSSN